MGGSSIETERLLLRALVEADAIEIAALFADPVVMEHYPRLQTAEEARSFVARHAARHAESGLGMMAIVSRATGTYLGHAGLVLRGVEGAPGPELELGWMLRREAWGHGHATEAGRALLAHARSIGHARVTSLVRPENVRSRRVAERLGMAPEREVQHAGLLHLVYARAL